MQKYFLNPCPRCGSDLGLRRNRAGKNHEWLVECYGCDLIEWGGKTKEEAITHVNKVEFGKSRFDRINGTKVSA